jgi:hypothetical protein
VSIFDSPTSPERKRRVRFRTSDRYFAATL